jgi:hypothetical protein
LSAFKYILNVEPFLPSDAIIYLVDASPAVLNQAPSVPSSFFKPKSYSSFVVEVGAKTVLPVLSLPKVVLSLYGLVPKVPRISFQ